MTLQMNERIQSHFAGAVNKIICFHCDELHFRLEDLKRS